MFVELAHFTGANVSDGRLKSKPGWPYSAFVKMENFREPKNVMFEVPRALNSFG